MDLRVSAAEVSKGTEPGGRATVTVGHRGSWLCVSSSAAAAAITDTARMEDGNKAREGLGKQMELVVIRAGG